MNVKTEYLKARAAYPLHRAIDALRFAKHEASVAGHSFPRFVGDVVTLDLPRGESITMTLESDSDSDACESLSMVCEPLSRYAEWPQCHDWWQGRDGIVYFTGDRRGERYTLQSGGYNFAQRVADARKRGLARHDAYLAARASVDLDAKTYRDACEDGYYGFVVTLLDADGEEIDSDSCWGFEASGDYAGKEALSAALHMQQKRADYWAACDHAQRLADAENAAAAAAAAAFVRMTA